VDATTGDRPHRAGPLAAVRLLRHPETKHWWIEALEADDPAGFETTEARPAFPGDERTAVKDPIVKLIDGRWHAGSAATPSTCPAPKTA